MNFTARPAMIIHLIIPIVVLDVGGDWRLDVTRDMLLLSRLSDLIPGRHVTNVGVTCPIPAEQLDADHAWHELVFDARDLKQIILVDFAVGGRVEHATTWLAMLRCPRDRPAVTGKMPVQAAKSHGTSDARCLI